MWKFLGSVYLAVPLFLLFGVLVALATFLEGTFDSHEVAERLIYHSVVFKILLLLCFVNILVSALHRFPFKKHHTFFLLTHLGLLMILTGTWIKIDWGSQGIVLLQKDQAVDTFISKQHGVLEVSSHQGTYTVDPFKGAQTLPHQLKLAHSRIEPNVHIAYHHMLDHGHLKLLDHPVTHDTICLAQETFRVDTQTPLNSFLDTQILVTLKDPLTQQILFSGNFATLACFTLPERFGSGHLLFDDNTLVYETPQGAYPIDCYGLYRFLHPFYRMPFPPARPFTIECQSQNTLLVDRTEHTTTLALIRDDGSFYQTSYPNDALSRYFAYDQGFAGYTLPIEIPHSFFLSRQDTEQQRNQRILEAGLNPEFLWLWQAQNRYLFENTTSQTFHTFDTTSYAHIASWIDLLIETLAQNPNARKDLEALGWPPIPLETLQTPRDLFDTITHQCFALDTQLPPIPHTVDPETALSAYLRHEGLALPAWIEHLPTTQDSMILESTLRLEVSPDPSWKSQERAIHCTFTHRGRQQTVLVPFDTLETHLKTPLFDRTYLVRYTPRKEPLPFQITLKDAQTTYHMGTQQPASYQADCLIDQTPCHLSMNQVYEDLSGIRLYLSSITPGPNPQVSLVVNHDPAKYFLTYPGSLFVVCGTFGLFFLRKHL